MIETVVVMFFLCLVFFWLYEFAELLTTHTVLDYAAARAARARAVGFNDFMVTKTVRVASMSMAGKCYNTIEDGGSGEEQELSTGALISRMGSYLECENESQTRGILDFALWDYSRLGWDCSEAGGASSDIIMRVWQKRPLYSSGDPRDNDIEDRLYTVRGEAQIESHYSFYLQ